MTDSHFLIPTPEQVEGPYFPVAFVGDEGNILANRSTHADYLELCGSVQDRQRQPISAALVVIWQADSRGRYHHPDDAYLGPIDPQFKYWGQCVTDAQGKYRFFTVKPGPYRDQDELRTPHIHFKVYSPDRKLLLTTQMYFPGEEMNEIDEHLQGLQPSLRPLLIASIKKGAEAHFDIVLKNEDLG